MQYVEYVNTFISKTFYTICYYVACLFLQFITTANMLTFYLQLLLSHASMNNNQNMIWQLTVIICDNFVEDGLGHGNGTSIEVRVEVESLPHLNARRWVTVGRQQGEYVILQNVPKLTTK